MVESTEAICTVAPRAGARIETLSRRGVQMDSEVAPRAGARIETLSRRGVQMDSEVAPRAGARIETSGRWRGCIPR